MATGIDLLLSPDTLDLEWSDRTDKFGLIEDGFAAGDATEQHQAILLNAEKGEFKLNPVLGIGISGMVNDEGYDFWIREVSRQMKSIGMTLESLGYNENNKKLDIDAHYD